MNLEALRIEIDSIDQEMMKLFKKRMEVSKKIGQYKKENGLPVLDVVREKELILHHKKQLNDDRLWPLYEAFIKEMMRLSKENQK
jgi:monofunctional chorismate mutase